MEDRDRGAMPEAARKFMGAVLTPGFAVKQWSQRAKRVPFGNPDDLSEREIRERAERAAIADMMPQIMGVRTFDDGKELTLKEKLGGLGGELLSFAAATPNKLVFDAGMKAGARAATASGLKGWLKRLLTYGAGGAAFGAKSALEQPLPASEADSIADFSKRLAGSMTRDAVAGAALGVGLHHALSGLGYAWARTLATDTPLMRTALKGNAQDFTNFFTRLGRRVDEGAATASERKAFENFSRWAKDQKVDLEALKKGELGMEYRRLVPREWTEQFPMLRNALPDSVERVRPRSTAIPREQIGGSSRQNGPVPERPAAKAAEPVEPLALPGTLEVAPASSPTGQGATPAGARPGAEASQPSPDVPSNQSPVRKVSGGTDELGGSRTATQGSTTGKPSTVSLEPSEISMKEHRAEVLRQLEAAIEAAPVQPEEVLEKHQGAYTISPQAGNAREAAFRERPMLEIQAGNQTIRVLNDRAHLENLNKNWKRNQPYKVSRESGPPQKEVIETYQNAPDEAQREAAMQGMTTPTLKKLGLDGDYMRSCAVRPWMRSGQANPAKCGPT